MLKARCLVLVMPLLTACPASAQSTDKLLKLHENLNDMCRDGASSKTGEACESRDVVDEILKSQNLCFGELGKVQRCRPTEQGGSSESTPSNSLMPPHEEPCQSFAEDQIVEAKGFLVQFDYAAEETRPTKTTAVMLDKPLCFEKEQATQLRIIMLNIKGSKLLGRHCLLEMRMVAGDSWTGSVRTISENKEIPD